MHHSEKIFQKVLMDGMQDMVFVIRIDEKNMFYYHFMNRAAMERTGLTKHVLGQSLQAVNSAETATRMIREYEKVMKTRASVTYEDSYVSSSGEKYYSQTELTPLFHSNGTCDMIVAVVKDISDQKRAELGLKETDGKLEESTQMYHSLFEYNSDGIYTLDLTGQVITGNRISQMITGYTPQELAGTSFFSLISLEDQATVQHHLYQAITGDAQNFQVTGLSKSGREMQVTLKFSPIVINKEITGLFIIMKDVTERVNLIEKFKESENRFRIIAENSSDLITLVDAHGMIVYLSPSCLDVLGFPYSNYVERHFTYNVHPDDIEKLKHSFHMSIKRKQHWIREFRQKHQMRGWIWSELHGTPVFDDQDRFIHMVVVTRDISLRKEYEAELEHFAYHDPLTRLPNRRLLKKRLNKALKECRLNDDGLAIIMMDIDYFKHINDQMGHDIGDEVITEFGKRVRQCIRKNDLVARLGGDEFVILLPQLTSPNVAESIAKDIQKAMQEPWSIGDYKLNVTASFGIAIFFRQDTSPYAMLKNADLALYRAKQSGRNSYKINEV
ncbi:diguanylate cyclase [Lentibacillus sp. N15]|uniref:sensor domain-containing protein n=1 Tax=Lentibacillus songyuanensis TaxID=3136161 RepID=UPI0031BA86C4